MNGMPEPADAMERNVTLTHLVYALHALAVLTGFVGTAAILPSFLASLPSIAAVVLNYLKRDAVRGTWLESHFRWQIRTFWFAWMWALVGVLLIATVVGVLFGVLVLIGTTLWVTYRVARGWWALGQRQMLPMPPV
ncbi:MAG: DUF4870 family protein [Rhodocyclaceae bacterium]